MPELPEVEVVKKSLENKIKNLIIKKVIITNNKLRYRINRKEFHKLQGNKIKSISRRSKYLFINLNTGLSLLIHLGMNGKFFIIDKKKQKYKTSFYYNIINHNLKHDHINFYLTKKVKLIYNDVRKFGFIKIIKTSEINTNKHIKLLGPEPLSNIFNKNYFNKAIINKKKSIKDLLIDQKFVSGIGNIYCNEILYLSRINPSRGIKNITKKETNKILFYTKKILKKSIEKGGSTIKDFNSADGKTGGFQQLFNVYAREGKGCKTKNCSEIIKKTYISNRSSFFCLKCQK